MIAAVPKLVWQIGIVLALLFVAYQVYRYTSQSENFTSIDNLEVPDSAPPLRQQPLRGPITVSSGGGNPPNVAPSLGMLPTAGPEVRATDPYTDNAMPANAEEEVRYPERSFSPGVIPQNTSIAQEAGVANAHIGPTTQAIQKFNPEFVTGGGEFFGQVAPMEDENPNYTAF
jgi:hypothetical protein